MKKSLIKPLLIVLGGMIIGGGTPAIAAEPIKIGHIRPLTGHMAIAGKRMVRAADFALQEVGYEVAGRKIEVIVGDSGSNPAMAVDIAKKMVQRDKVDVLFGPTVGGTQMAVAAYANKIRKPHILSNPAPFGIIAKKLKWTIQSGGQEGQIASAMGRYAAENLGYETVTAIAADWAPGHGFLNGFMGGFKQYGGKVVQEQYPPVRCNDYASYLAKLKDADAVTAWFDGTDSIKFLTQLHELGIRKRMPLVAAFHGSFFAPFMLYQYPPAVSQAIIGELTPTPYTSLLETDVNRKFVNAFRAKYNETPEDTETGPYQAMQVLLAALEATGGDTDPKKLRQALLNVDIEGPEGHVLFDQKTMAAIKDVYIVKVEKKGKEFVWTPVHKYPSAPALGFGPPPGPPKKH